MFFRYVSAFFAFGLILGSQSIWSSDPWQDLSQEKVKEILNFSAIAFDRYRKPANFKALKEEGQWKGIKEFSGTTGYYIPCTLGFMAHRKPSPSSSAPAEIMIAFRGIEMNRYELPDLLQIHGSFLKDIFDTWRGNSSNASDLLNIKGTIPSASLSFLTSVEKDLVEKLDQSLERLSDYNIRITLTGATFGGTLAALAAPLIQKHLQEKSKKNVSIRTMTFGAANLGDAEFKREYDASFPLLDIKIPDPALSGISNISSSLTKTQSLGTTITLSPIASTASASSMLGTYWSNFKSYFCPPPFTPLVFNQPTFRLDVVCVEDFCAKDKDKEIYEALKKMQ